MNQVLQQAYKCIENGNGQQLEELRRSFREACKFSIEDIRTIVSISDELPDEAKRLILEEICVEDLRNECIEALFLFAIHVFRRTGVRLYILDTDRSRWLRYKQRRLSTRRGGRQCKALTLSKR